VLSGDVIKAKWGSDYKGFCPEDGATYSFETFVTPRKVTRSQNSEVYSLQSEKEE
jgi:hypothetical protein